MTVLLVVAALIVAWCVLPLPVAMAFGRAFRAGGSGDAEIAAPRYDTAGV